MGWLLDSSRALVVLALAGLAAALAACSPAPCTTCVTVNGTYGELSQAAYVDCGARRSLSFGGGHAAATVSQTGSALGLDALDTHLAGVLHADGSASFGPVPAWAQPVDGAGNPDPSGAPTPGKLYLEGWFLATDGSVAAFDGTYLFIADPDGCELDARVQWRR